MVKLLLFFVLFFCSFELKENIQTKRFKTEYSAYFAALAAGQCHCGLLAVEIQKPNCRSNGTILVLKFHGHRGMSRIPKLFNIPSDR